MLEPCGILLGGVRQGSAEEDGAALNWDDIMLGGGEVVVNILI